MTILLDKFELVENQGYFYLIHQISKKTFANRYVNMQQAIDVAMKLERSWINAGIEATYLKSTYFLMGEETCRTVGLNMRYID